MIVILWTKKWAEENQKKIKFFKTLKSSNATAKELKILSTLPTLLIAEEQTNPYGREGRKWIPSDFMATWTWQSVNTLSPVFSPLSGLNLYNTFQKVWPSDLWSLKAPNDIYLADKKIAGILLETKTPSLSNFQLAPQCFAPAKPGIRKHKNVQIIFGLGINVLTAPPNTECIKNHFSITESSWRNFLDDFWQSLINLINKNVSELSLDESQALTKTLQRHPQYKNLLQVRENGSLVFKDKTTHWSDL